MAAFVFAAETSGASAAESPAARAIVLVKQSVTSERNALRRIDSYNYAKAIDSLDESKGQLASAYVIVDDGKAAGSVGHGLRPTKVNAALGMIAGAIHRETGKSYVDGRFKFETAVGAAVEYLDDAEHMDKGEKIRERSPPITSFRAFQPGALYAGEVILDFTCTAPLTTVQAGTTLTGHSPCQRRAR